MAGEKRRFTMSCLMAELFAENGYMSGLERANPNEVDKAMKTTTRPTTNGGKMDIQVMPCARCGIPIAINSRAGEWNCCDTCTSFLEFQDDGI